MSVRTTSEWRWLALSAVLGIMPCAALAADAPPAKTPSAAQSEAKNPVKFSDAKTNEVRVDIASPTLPFQLKNEAPRRGGSSLDSVGSLPFGPVPNVLPGVLSRRERDARDARNTWILDPGKGLAINEENANRAFGVRSHDLDTSEKQTDRPASFWEAYFRKTTENTSTRRSPVLEPSTKERRESDPFQRYYTLGLTEFDNSAVRSANRQENRVLFSDTPSLMPVRGGLADTLSGAGRDMVRESLNFTAGPSAGRPESGAAADRAERFQRLLGIEPAARSDAATPQAIGTPPLAETGESRELTGLRDPLGLSPDPTRRELNPVTARPAPELAGSSALNLTDPISGLTPRPAPQRHSLIDMAPMRSLMPPTAAPDPNALNPSRRITYSPTTLEMPRRGF